MVKLLTVAAVTGVWFVAWQIYRRGRGQKSLDNHARFNDARPGDRVTLEDYYIAKGEAVGLPRRFLNVNNFGIAELEVSVVICGLCEREDESSPSLSILPLSVVCRASQLARTTELSIQRSRRLASSLLRE